MIQYEKNLVRYTKFLNRMNYITTADKKRSLACDTTEREKINFVDENGNVVEAGIIEKSDKDITLYDYQFSKNSDDEITDCHVTKSHFKNDKSLDIEKTTEVKYFDHRGRLIKKSYLTRDGIEYNDTHYEYDNDNNLISITTRDTHTITTTRFYKDQVESIIDKTIRSKITNTKYRAYFDAFGRVYKIYDGDHHIERTYERDIDDEGNILSETVRYYDISGEKKLISYETKAYNPAAGFKISKIIKNGIIVMQYTYDQNGDEVSSMDMETVKGVNIFTRTERHIDSDTGNITETKRRILIDKITQKVIKESTTKSVYDKTKKMLLSYSEITDDVNLVTTYEYDENGNRTSAITKQLIDDEFKVIDDIKYEREESDDSKSKKRTCTSYDVDGNIVCKSIHNEYVNETEEVHEHEVYDYKVDKK